MAQQDTRRLTDLEIAAVTGAVIEPPPPAGGGGLGDILKDAMTPPKPIEDQVIIH